MNDKFFQRIFGQKSHESLPRTRRLAHEALENREMLNADWSGFAQETVSEYEPGGAAYSVQLPSNVDAVKLVNLEGSSACELVSIYGQGKTVSVYTADNSGEFRLKSEQKIEALGNWNLYSDAVFKDFNNDGYDDMLLVSSTGMKLSACVYTWNATTSSFEAGTVYSLNESKFVGASSRYVFTELHAAVVANDVAGYDLILQVNTLDPTSQEISTCVFAGVGKSTFGQNPTLKTAIVGDLLGSTTVDGEDYLLLRDATNTTNYLVLSKLNSDSTTKTYYDFSGYGQKFIFNWVAEQDGFLVLGSILADSMKSGLISLNLTSAPADNATVDAKPLGKWYNCDSFSLTANSCGAIGNVGGDADPELLVANDEANASVFYLGDASTAYGYTFTQSEVVVSTPDYNSARIGDYNNDGRQDALLAGSNALYVADVDSEGGLSNERILYKFSQPVAETEFGDFNGDGLVDFAVRFKANVGSSLQTYIQVANGQFLLTATQTVPGTLVDFTVGRFTQTSRDEIAALYTLYKNATITSFVSSYKYDSNKIALVSTATASYSGVGTSIAAGELFGSGRDDLVVVNSSADTASIFKNTGTSFAVSTVSTRYEGTDFCYPTSAAIGDFNGDGLADLAVMNSSAGSNVAEVAYYLRGTSGIGSKPTGRVRINSTISVTDNTSVVGQLKAANFNGDAYDDLVFIRRATTGASYASVILGNGESSVFNPIENFDVSCDAASGASTIVAQVNANDACPDLVWVQDKSVGVLINTQTVETSGQVQYVLQSLSTKTPGASYADAVASQRSWLDEWSNFYVDVWASADGSSVTAVSGSFAYDPNYFTFVDAKAVSGYTVSANAASGSVSYTASGSSALDASGWTVVARLQFQPVKNGGLALANDGALYAVNPGFAAPASAQSVNGSVVASVAVPTGVEVYPVAYDLNDNGEVDLEDFAYFISYYPTNPTSAIPVAKHRVLDTNANMQYDLEDFSYAIASYPSKYSDGLDSGYAIKPVVRKTSSALLDADLVAAVLDSDSDFVDEVEIAAVAEFAPIEATVRTFEQTFGVSEQRPLVTEQAVFFCGPMNKAAAESDLDLAVEWDLDL